mmetsp:Transcript_91002/g.181504  ORF Transcript_91002/g.181504 Transcript_91002/m.181504 type:complete len:156 (-) Transcript_91002:698-1165(-)
MASTFVLIIEYCRAAAPFLSVVTDEAALSGLNGETPLVFISRVADSRVVEVESDGGGASFGLLKGLLPTEDAEPLLWSEVPEATLNSNLLSSPLPPAELPWCAALAVLAGFLFFFCSATRRLMDFTLRSGGHARTWIRILDGGGPEEVTALARRR